MKQLSLLTMCICLLVYSPNVLNFSTTLKGSCFKCFSASQRCNGLRCKICIGIVARMAVVLLLMVRIMWGFFLVKLNFIFKEWKRNKHLFTKLIFSMDAGSVAFLNLNIILSYAFQYWCFWAFVWLNEGVYKVFLFCFRNFICILDLFMSTAFMKCI